MVGMVHHRAVSTNRGLDQLLSQLFQELPPAFLWISRDVSIYNVIQTQCSPFEHYMDRVPSLALQLDDLENGDGQCLEEAL